MSGAHDPTNCQLPQKPMHRCLFPLATTAGGTNLRGVTNPYSASFDNVRYCTTNSTFDLSLSLSLSLSPYSFLGCSGQNVSDIYRFVTVTDRMRILENTLKWCHISPTAPDTLGTTE